MSGRRPGNTRPRCRGRPVQPARVPSPGLGVRVDPLIPEARHQRRQGLVGRFRSSEASQVYQSLPVDRVVDSLTQVGVGELRATHVERVDVGLVECVDEEPRLVDAEVLDEVGYGRPDHVAEIEISLAGTHLQVARVGIGQERDVETVKMMWP